MTPDALDAAVTVAMAELMLSGCTTTTDHHYVFGIDIEIAAAKRLGIRTLLTRGSMNLSERDGGLPLRCAGRRYHSRRQQKAGRSLSPAR